MSITQTFSNMVASVKSIPRKLFGTRNDRLLKVLRRHVDPINDFEGKLRGQFDERFEKESGARGIEDLPEEEREAARRELRIELCADLMERVRSLREMAAEPTTTLANWWHGLSSAEQGQEYHRQEYRKRFDSLMEKLDANGMLPEAFAVLREASRRAKNHRHFDCQLIGGRVLFEGRIAEMKTGEGKTIVCHLSAFVNQLCGRKVHIITVNDYLVQRDADFAAPIFELLGISVGYIQSQVDPGGREGIRHAAYACDITYGTNSEFGFDYLRDNMKTQLAEQVQGRLDFVIVDEVDSILIDEARTPLIISGPARDDVTRYPRANKVAEELVRRQLVWDRKVLATVAKFDGNTHNIPKLEDALNILGYRKSSDKKSKKVARGVADDSPTEDVDGQPKAATLGPDFLTDDQVEAIQIYENDVLKVPMAEQYRRLFIIQLERKQAGLTHDGVTVAQELLDVGSLYGGANMEWPHLIENALRAHKVYRRDSEYVVQDGQIIIVDPFTGRLMHGRQWSDGLHQAVEAREHVRVKEETQTLATITIQNFIKLYLLKAGMTGTAQTEATEFDKIYGLDVVEIPTNRPVNRVDHNDKMFRNTDEKFGSIVDEIHEVHLRGRPADPFVLADALTALKPIAQKQGQDTSRIDESLRKFNDADLGDQSVIRFMAETYDEFMGDIAHGRSVLVGTTSVETSEKISKLLEQRYGTDHEVLNAKNHAREAEIVMKAGCLADTPTSGDKTPRGNVTIATNMAGRGTDIKLGHLVVYPKCKVPDELPAGVESNPLYPAGITKCCMHCEEYDAATNCAHCFKPKIDSRFPEMGRNVCPVNVPCGLHIIGTERHESRRIDNQLRGRSGRQGDPGSSRFSLSLQDDLMKLFMPDFMLKMMDKLGFSDGSSLEDKRLNKGIERAQRKVEERNFSTRKHLLEWDEPMDYQRKEFYSARQRILEERDLPELIFDTVDNSIQTTLDQYYSPGFVRSCIAEWCRSRFELVVEEDSIQTDDLEAARDSIIRAARDNAYDEIRTSFGEYIDTEEPAAQWDISGLLQWASRKYKLSMTQNQMRKMDPGDIQDALFAAADAQLEQLDVSSMAVFLDPNYPQEALAEWARTKFEIALDVQELLANSPADVATLLDERVHEAYRQRTIAYPVEWCLERAFGEERTDQAASADAVARWVNWKFRADWTIEDVQGKPIGELRDTLIAMSESHLDGKLDREIEEIVDSEDDDAAVAWAKDRFGHAWNQQRYDESTGDTLEALKAQGREMLRWELTRLEQYVLLRLYDQAWKDHLLEMDHLKTSIMQRPLGGDQTHPQSQFAIEGRGMFTQMWARIAARVTDIIFKVKITGREGGGAAAGSGGPGGSPVSYGHADATGAGFAGGADQEAAMRAQNSEAKVETIRREQPKVGRNEPCPCGSGKKFKQCHGRQ